MQPSIRLYSNTPFDNIYHSEYKGSFQENPVEFVKSEKLRTDGFINRYRKTAWTLIIIALVTLLILIFFDNLSVRSTCLIILLF